MQSTDTLILGKTPSEILADLSDWRILHCENILRQDLANGFLHYQQEWREKLMKLKFDDLQVCFPKEHQRARESQASKEQLVDYLIKPRITFHGTRRDNVPSIVQHGFLKPGQRHPVTKKPLEVEWGSTLGRGIYCSPNPGYALKYADEKETERWQLPGLKLVICATIMGRAAEQLPQCAGRDDTTPVLDADSYVNRNQMQYVVFNPAQIIPCYVIHLHYRPNDDDDMDLLWNLVWRVFTRGLAHGRIKQTPVVVPYVAPGDKQRKKAALIAKGQKFFSYGYGPISGKQLIIEDVAEVDEGEEDYGEYQAVRADAEPSNTSVWDEDWGKSEE